MTNIQISRRMARGRSPATVHVSFRVVVDSSSDVLEDTLL